MKAPVKAGAMVPAGYGARSLCDYQGGGWEQEVVYKNERELMYVVLDHEMYKYTCPIITPVCIDLTSKCPNARTLVRFHPTFSPACTFIPHRILVFCVFLLSVNAVLFT